MWSSLQEREEEAMQRESNVAVHEVLDTDERAKARAACLVNDMTSVAGAEAGAQIVQSLRDEALAANLGGVLRRRL